MKKVMRPKMTFWYVQRTHLDTGKVDKDYWPADSFKRATEQAKAWSKRDAGKYSYSTWSHTLPEREVFTMEIEL